MKTKAVLCLLMGVWYLCGGCIKKCPNKSFFTDETKSYFVNFKPGDYWIYKNVANGDLDSVYFVSAQIEGNDLTAADNCPQEYAIVQFNGLANLPMSYIVNSWGGEFSAYGRNSGVGFLSQSSVEARSNSVVQGVIYANVITLTDCCITGCYARCPITTFQFDRLYFAPRKGIIRWEASNHPQFGKVTYELIRTNIQ